MTSEVGKELAGIMGAWFDMRVVNAFRVVVIFIGLMWGPAQGEEALIDTATLKGGVSIRSWKTLRDERIIKQNLDYSCGAASLATILGEFYRVEITEREVLGRMEKDGAASFADLAQVAGEYGFRAQGLALSFDKLRTLRIPCIAYLKYRGENHFSVIRGVGMDGRVWLADPSLGNRQFTAAQFKAIWETRDDPRLKGKILLIVPGDGINVKLAQDFFREPERWESLAVEVIGMRLP